ncbi:hypothetical protein PVAP13_5NG613201 [Panicum virgatum]|uniref:Uncharacterized protein n=1 Tax=Panicum virgatum TaxID=38727 RepID=A0A8T0SA97_PANVG|nr:hypothetical protein PVAP13_5NG613201 [Panicum virgatum]
MIPPAFSTGRTGRAPDHRHRPPSCPDPVKLLAQRGNSTGVQSPVKACVQALGAAHCCAGCCTRGRPWW